MRFESILERERELAEERRSKCQGSARIKLENLHFPFEESREPDTQQIRKLKTLFSGEKGCRDRDARNHVVAVIQKQHLEVAMAAAGIAPGNLCSKNGYDYPDLDFPAGYRLNCLHGQQRVLAGLECLPPGDQRWTVDIFLADMSSDLRITLIEEYSLEKGPDDGEFYRKIREYQGYQGRGNQYLENKWWARLHAMHKNSARGLKRILAKPLYRKAFDVQLEIPGLGSGMRLSTSQKMLAMRCDEQIINYLNYIREVWYRFLRGDQVALRKIDRLTVKALELTAPGACRADREALYARITKGEIFSAFDNETRQRIWEEILLASQDRLIPSLYTFWEDVNYLKGPSDCIRLLVPSSAQETLSAALIRAFSDINQESDQCVIQILENRFISQPGTRSVRVELGCRQLWLSAMRHFHEIPTLPKRNKKALLAKPIIRTNDNVLREFAALAFRLGFETAPIRDLIHQSPDRELARANLMQARPPRQYEYDAVNFEHFIEQIMNFYAAAKERTEQVIANSVDTNSTEEFLPPRRCGLPEADKHQNDVSSIYLHSMSTAHEEGDTDEISSLFVRRSVYFAFFGRPGYRIQPITTSSPENQVESSIARHPSQTESMDGVVMEKDKTGFVKEQQPEFGQYHRVQRITTSSLENQVESFSQTIARPLSQTESMDGVVMEECETGFEKEQQPEFDQYQMITARLDESSQEQAKIQKERISLEKQQSQVQHNLRLLEEGQNKVQEDRALLINQQSQFEQYQLERRQSLEQQQVKIQEDRALLTNQQSQFEQYQLERRQSLEQEQVKIQEDRALLTNQQSQFKQYQLERRQSLEQEQVKIQEDRALLTNQQSQFEQYQLERQQSLGQQQAKIQEERTLFGQKQAKLQSEQRGPYRRERTVVEKMMDRRKSATRKRQQKEEEIESDRADEMDVDNEELSITEAHENSQETPEGILTSKRKQERRVTQFELERLI